MSPFLLTSSLTAADVGRRVVVRWSLPDGQASDVLGELESWTDHDLRVRRRDGSPQVVPLAAVLAGKVVDARWARDVAAGEVQRIASRAWPAFETEQLGGWELRAAGGWSRRANSALLVGSPGLPLDAAAVAIERWYAARSMPAVAQLPLPLAAAADEVLAARGWAMHAQTDMRVADLVGIARIAGPPVTLADAPSNGWLAVLPNASPLAVRVITGVLAVYASVDVDGMPVAVGRGCVTTGWLGIAQLNVAPSFRRRGLARALVSALADWGVALGARHAYLQVEADNAAAIGLYDGLGFALHHRYHYRVAP